MNDKTKPPTVTSLIQRMIIGEAELCRARAAVIAAESEVIRASRDLDRARGSLAEALPDDSVYIHGNMAAFKDTRGNVEIKPWYRAETCENN